jgi:methyl-accepting chemotaxis protein
MKATSIMGALLVLALAGGAGGCSKRDEAMGPAQKAGQQLDNAGDKVAREVHDKLDRANQAAQQAANSAEQTKDKIAEATAEAAADASKGLNKATEEVGKKVERAGEKIQESAKK